MGTPAQAPNLDQGPPLPPNLQPQPQPSMQSLAGQSSPNGSASLQQTIIQKLMFVEQSLSDIGQMLPAAAPVMNGLIDQMRKGMGTLLAKGVTPPAAPVGGTGGAQMMMPPVGGPAT